MLVDPMPPMAPIALPWDAEVADPIVAIAGARAACGDTFVVDSPDGPFLFLFSPAGVRSFYALPEDRASKGIADWRMISRKLPEELFDGRRTMPHDLFGRAGTQAYLAQLEQAADEVLGESVDERLAAGAQDDLFQQIVDRWSDQPPDAMRRGVARDVVLVHLGSMSNLFAALGWTIVDLLAHPEQAAAVAAGDAQLAERCALESTRLAQRSIMLRYVHQPVEVVDEVRTYAVSPGATIATLLPLTNLGSAPGLDRWDPERWKGRRLRDADALAAVELVTAFGHGSHTCPAQPFSLAAMSRTVMRLFATFTMTPAYDHAEPLPVQIGGVARAAAPCPVSYSL